VIDAVGQLRIAIERLSMDMALRADAKARLRVTGNNFVTARPIMVDGIDYHHTGESTPGLPIRHYAPARR
jgi:hypothetical protein